VSQTTVKISTSGMHCSSCAMLVDMTLADVEGVSDSRTDHATGETVVSFDDERVSVEQLLSAIRGAGYEADVAG